MDWGKAQVSREYKHLNGHVFHRMSAPVKMHLTQAETLTVLLDAPPLKETLIGRVLLDVGRFACAVVTTGTSPVAI
jgi:hypothetical protein